MLCQSISLDSFWSAAYDLNAMIEVEGVRFCYAGGVPALDGISLEINPGERVAVMGANGSGKTTLARCLNGLLVPQQGLVRVEGLVTSSADDLLHIRERVGMVFQNPDDQLVATSVETEIAFGLENLGVAPTEMHERVNQALNDFGLVPYRHHPPHQLSGGERQRVAIAAAMVLRPAYLVLDEPTSLLDPRSRDTVLELLRELPERYGTATIHITQRSEEAACAERLVIMDAGQLYADGAPATLFAQGESLRALGLDVPFPVALAQALHRNGLDLGGTPQQLADQAWLRRQLANRIVRPAAVRPHVHPAFPGARMATEEVTYAYDRGLPTHRTALNGVSVNLPAGLITALLGPSGSGKTTLAQHLNALLRPHRGRVLLDGRDIWSQPLPLVRQRVGLVFQFPEMQLFAESVAADVAYGPRNLGWEESDVQRAVERGLAAVDLPCDRFGERAPLTLSGGQRRRAALAGILAMEPDVLVLDEPTAGLDARAGARMMGILSELAATGKTVLLITHDMELVADLVSHVVVLAGGSVVLEGDTRTVLAAPGFEAQSGLEQPPALHFATELNRDTGLVHGAPLTLEELVTNLLHSCLTPEASEPAQARG